ncbi:MAG: DUF58 domain-containing protein [Planctomycetota bacterium]
MPKPANQPKRSRRYALRGGGVAYLLITFVMGMAAVNSQANILFWAFGLLMACFFISCILTTMMLRGIEVRRSLPDHGAVDEAMPLRYEIVNNKRWMPAFGVIVSEIDAARSDQLCGGMHAWAMHVGPRDSAAIETLAWPTRRGAARLNRLRVSTAFPFGIVRHSIILHLEDQIVVYPKIHRLRTGMVSSIQSHDTQGSQASKSHGGHDEFFGLREYIEGDNFRDVDWKHSARLGKLVSREMTHLTPNRLMVLLDLRFKGEAPYDAAERAICFAASVIAEAYRDGLEIGLAVAGTPAPAFNPHHARYHRAQLLHTLGEIDLSKNQTTPHHLEPTNTRWLVIHSGETDRSFGPSGAQHLSHEALESWTTGSTLSPEPADTEHTPRHQTAQEAVIQ